MRRDRSGPGPLAGMRMIELRTLLAGPLAGRLLGDMRAQIIKLYDVGLERGDVVSLDECLAALEGLVGTHAR